MATSLCGHPDAKAVKALPVGNRVDFLSLAGDEQNSIPVRV